MAKKTFHSLHYFSVYRETSEISIFYDGVSMTLIPFMNMRAIKVCAQAGTERNPKHNNAGQPNIAKVTFPEVLSYSVKVTKCCIAMPGSRNWIWRSRIQCGVQQFIQTITINLPWKTYLSLTTIWMLPGPAIPALQQLRSFGITNYVLRFSVPCNFGLRFVCNHG